ncbi:ABC transporter permease [Chelativorans sp. AA-79]|uniref:ABC transporter permease n=1 Tax=Chelativorans sp. AA-79 TaxID=3028735 RepID=UPI0023F90AC3|nr:ABC transporter permease [Chelativorans sp. AA-79]WEX09678.1 ABC transporter permease [Chelativorans sp. AA-79]
MLDTTRRLVRSPQGLLGMVILGTITALALIGPYIAPHGAEAFNITSRFQGPGSTFLLGTDQFGRDLLSRILLGAQSTLFLAVAATLLGTGIGAVIGTLSAYLGGIADEIIMRVLDAVMAIPSLLLALLIVTAAGASATNALLAIGIALAPGMARITRAASLAIREQDYVNAAVARGESGTFIVMREMMPNVLALLVVECTIRIGFAVMTIATLSFLGLGAQPPSSEWGLMVSEARDYLFRNPWMMIWPGLAIALLAIGFNLLGDGLRDAINPRER